MDVEVPLPSIWLLCSESGAEATDVEESAAASTEAELGGGVAVTVENDPKEEEEEVDLGSVAVSGSVGGSGAFTPEAAAGWLESWLDPPA